jgi:hypothetical protein
MDEEWLRTAREKWGPDQPLQRLGSVAQQRHQIQNSRDRVVLPGQWTRLPQAFIDGVDNRDHRHGHWYLSSKTMYSMYSGSSYSRMLSNNVQLSRPRTMFVFPQGNFHYESDDWNSVSIASQKLDLELFELKTRYQSLVRIWSPFPRLIW